MKKKRKNGSKNSLRLYSPISRSRETSHGARCFVVDDRDDAEITGRDHMWLGTSGWSRRDARNENTFRDRAKHRSNYFCSALETGANVDRRYRVPTNRLLMIHLRIPRSIDRFSKFFFFFVGKNYIVTLAEIGLNWLNTDRFFKRLCNSGSFKSLQLAVR